MLTAIEHACMQVCHSHQRSMASRFEDPCTYILALTLWDLIHDKKALLHIATTMKGRIDWIFSCWEPGANFKADNLQKGVLHTGNAISKQWRQEIPIQVPTDTD